MCHFESHARGLVERIAHGASEPEVCACGKCTRPGRRRQERVWRQADPGQPREGPRSRGRGCSWRRGWCRRPNRDFCLKRTDVAGAALRASHATLVGCWAPRAGGRYGVECRAVRTRRHRLGWPAVIGERLEQRIDARPRTSRVRERDVMSAVCHRSRAGGDRVGGDNAVLKRCAGTRRRACGAAIAWRSGATGTRRSLAFPL
jgi:hypothetical protein